MKKYKQLTLEQRYQIPLFLKLGIAKSEIAKSLGVHKSTVYRELKRNLSKRGYRPQFADNAALRRRSNKAKVRISVQTWTEIEADLRIRQWSPEQISGGQNLYGKQKVSHEWIYQHIYRDKLNNDNLYEHLRCRKKRKKRYGSYSKRGTLVNQISIEDASADCSR
jgi:transposase, IS30 family